MWDLNLFSHIKVRETTKSSRISAAEDSARIHRKSIEKREEEEKRHRRRVNERTSDHRKIHKSRKARKRRDDDDDDDDDEDDEDGDTYKFLPLHLTCLDGWLAGWLAEKRGQTIMILGSTICMYLPRKAPCKMHLFKSNNEEPILVGFWMECTVINVH